MSTINLGELVKGLMVVVGFAVSMGKLLQLERWAAQEAFGMRRHVHHIRHVEHTRKSRGKKAENFRQDIATGGH